MEDKNDGLARLKAAQGIPASKEGMRGLRDWLARFGDGMTGEHLRKARRRWKGDA